MIMDMNKEPNFMRIHLMIVRRIRNLCDIRNATQD